MATAQFRKYLLEPYLVLCCNNPTSYNLPWFQELVCGTETELVILPLLPVTAGTSRLLYLSVFRNNSIGMSDKGKDLLVIK